jgi:hypothetical protein
VSKNEKEIEAPHDFNERTERAEAFSPEDETGRIVGAFQRLQRWVRISKDSRSKPEKEGK